MKPSATAFERALASVGAKPSEVAFIDDREENVRGAKDYGIRWAFRFTSLARLRKDVSKAITEAGTAQ
jgi:putative hydrolase of the HAD superfamily